MGPFKKPEVKLKINYRRTFELALIVSLLLHLGFFHMLPEFEIVTSEIKSKPIEIKVEDIPQTEQVRNLPSPPARPTMPIPTESEDIPEDVTIESTELQLDLSKIPPPPPPPEDEGIEERYVFVPYDEPPYPIGGYAAIQKNLKYPEIARKAGIEGLVIIGIL
ncbi:MAG: energy transducer TonB, partial [bacterium]